MITPNVTDSWDDGKRLHVVGNIVVSGNYTQGGDLLNFNIYQLKSASAPEFIDFNGQSIYNYNMVYGTLITNGLLKIIASTTGELASGPYPNAVINDVITFHGIFKKYQ